MGLFKRFGEKLTESPEQQQAQEVRQWCGEIRDVEQLAECRTRSRARVAGVVESIKVIPGENSTTLEVSIFDGTDKISGVWFGRRTIPGIELGQRIILEGTVASTSRGRQIINPSYELIAA